MTNAAPEAPEARPAAKPGESPGIRARRNIRACRRMWKHDLALVPEFPLLCGVDEAGRGPLAGSVVAACVVLDLSKPPLTGLNDSKQLTAEEREDLFDRIRDNALGFGVGEASPEEIDKRNILGGTFLAMQRALAAMALEFPAAPTLILVDGNQRIPDIRLPQRCLVKGDGLSACIAAASVLAKVTRDRMMDALHLAHPEYGFGSHKGYATREHQEAIERHGLAPCHRRSFILRDSAQLSLFEE